MNLKEKNLDTLQEIYAFKFYKVYNKFPLTKHLEKDRNLLIRKIKILIHLEKKGHLYEEKN